MFVVLIFVNDTIFVAEVDKTDDMYIHDDCGHNLDDDESKDETDDTIDNDTDNDTDNDADDKTDHKVINLFIVLFINCLGSSNWAMGSCTSPGHELIIYQSHGPDLFPMYNSSRSILQYPSRPYAMVN